MYLRSNTRKGYRYYSVVEAERRGDKVKQITLDYIGRLDNREPYELNEIETRIAAFNEPKLVERFRQELFKLGYTAADLMQVLKSLEYGDMAALYQCAELIDLPSIIRKHTAKGGGPDAGKVVTNMAICHATAPTSKNGMRDWYEETALTYLSGIEPAQMEEWILYSCMAHLTKDRIERIEEAIVVKLVEVFEIDMDTWLYDLTSTYFYCKKDWFKKHGYSRDHLSHLVQVVIALAVTKEDGIPIKHWVHPGNTTDVTTLPDAATQLKTLYDHTSTTLVFDRGNLSETNVLKLDELTYDFVCGLKRHVKDVKALIREARDNAKFELFNIKMDGEGKGWLTIGTTMIVELWGKERKIVISFSEELLETRRKTRQKAIKKIEANLKELKKKVTERRYSHDRLVIALYKILEGHQNLFPKIGKMITDHPSETIFECRKTEAGKAANQRKLRWVDKRIERLKVEAPDLSPEEVRSRLDEVFNGHRRKYRYRVRETKPRSTFKCELDEEALKTAREFDGFHVLISTDLSLSAEEIVELYDSRDVVEKVFCTMKNIVRVRPIGHWVPHMIRAHIYICILAHLLRQILKLLLKRAEYSDSFSRAFTLLRRVKLVECGSAAQSFFKLTHLTEQQRELFKIIGISLKPPTVSEEV